MNNRLISELKKHIFICGIGFLYCLWIEITNIYIPCVFRLITGLKCPGCGISHMIVSICKLDFLNAFKANELLFITLPAVAIIYIAKKIHFINTGTKMPDGKIMRFLEYSFLVLIIIFWIVRNL